VRDPRWFDRVGNSLFGALIRYIGSCAKGSAPPLRIDRAPITAKKGSSFKAA
jgi:hypothetical protein